MLLCTVQDLKQEIGECGLYYYSVCLKFFVWLKGHL